MQTNLLVCEDIAPDLAFSALNEFHIASHADVSKVLCEDIGNISIRVEATKLRRNLLVLSPPYYERTNIL